MLISQTNCATVLGILEHILKRRDGKQEYIAQWHIFDK